MIKKLQAMLRGSCQICGSNMSFNGICSRCLGHH